MPKKKPSLGKKIFEGHQDDELTEELEKLGVEFYEGNPQVTVKVRYRVGTGPKTRAVLAKLDLDDESESELIQRAFDELSEGFWNFWSDEHAEIRKSIFGKSAKVSAEGRSGGHLVVDVGPWGFTTENKDDDTVIDNDKVDRWLSVVGQIKEEISPGHVDKSIAAQIKILAADLEGPKGTSETTATRPEDVVKAAARLGLETSGRGEVWTIYAGDRFHKLAAPENLHEVLTWASEIMVEHKDADKAKEFLRLASIAEEWTE